MAADRIAVLGAGSVGCFIGGAWQAAGLPVTFIGRPTIARDIHEHGLTVSDFSGWSEHLESVEFSCVPAALGEASIILVAVKSGDTADAAREIRDNANNGALVISFQNGVSNVDVLKRELGDRFEVVRGMVPFNCAYLGEGRFHKGLAGAPLYAEDLARTRALAKRIGAGPAALSLSNDMLGIAWGKLLINLNNAINALSGRPLREQLRERDYRRVFAAAMREGLRTLRRAKVRPAKVGAVGPSLLPLVIGSPDWLFNTVFIRSWKIDEKARSSMSDDLAHGRKTEVDYINGELVLLAERLGTDATINRLIVELVREAEAGAPPLGPRELRSAVLGG
ncbi:MAG TPA: 2-dehydropantoate 2-reductase [Sphingomicrobium sp.]|nr:2-dehydropantoate 2-reductase [Sphingomicrobium sp.]